MRISALTICLYWACIATGYGCNGTEAGEDKKPVPPHYSLVAIEMKMRRLADGPQDKYDVFDAYLRFRFAGPSVVPEFTQALESEERGDRYIAAVALLKLSENDKWPEVFTYIADRIKRLPKGDEAGMLLYAMAHDGAHSYKDLVPYVANYLNDSALVTNVSWTNFNERHTQELQTKHLACLVLQLLTGENFGAQKAPTKITQEHVDRAKTWAQENPERVKLPRKN
jgi:hypothetical protein